jgi:ribose 1,5-bisphosphokinase
MNETSNTPAPETRYSLYFAPEQSSPWWQAGCRWLGRDPALVQALPQPALSNVTAAEFHTLTSDARRYGFHATLKAPFRLAEDCTLAQLDAALRAFCQQQHSLIIPAPQVEWMGNFLALRPHGDASAINRFAMACVSTFDSFRAPLSAADIARRQRHPLSDRQMQLLQRWGYPYTEEEFRFHMTLTDALHEPVQAEAICQAAQNFFTIDAPLQLNGLALFTESAPGTPFQLVQRYAFGAENDSTTATSNEMKSQS